MLPDHRPRWMTADSGQDLIEYALICAVFSLIMVAVLPSAGESLSQMYSRARSTMEITVEECGADPDGRTMKDGPPGHCH